ncbi:MAG TPA: response regulator [Gemmatimonadales bacterium]|nr:response regulator [Gemmatimonadales bacterium]
MTLRTDLFHRLRDSGAEHGFTPVQEQELMSGIYRRGDRLMVWFLVTHFIVGFLLAFYHDTWGATLLVGGATVGGFLFLVWRWPGSFFTRAMASVAQQAFVALHIYQLQGQSEQHFWFFTALTMMIVYQDWLCMWPGTLLIIGQHLVFAWLHNNGYHVHFFPEAHVGFTKLFFHFGIALVQVGICGYWAHLLRKQTLEDAWQKHELSTAGELLERQLSQAMASKQALDATTEALRESNRRQRAILDNTGDLAWVKDTAGHYIAANPALAAALGRPIAEIEGRTDREMFPAAVVDILEHEDDWVIGHAKPLRVEREIQIGGRRRITVESIMTPILDQDGHVIGITGMGRDITARKSAEADRTRLEAKVQHAQKLESLGVLAGGLAHDFNNLLVGILGNVGLMQEEMEPGAPMQEWLTDVEHAARRAADLTSQMLAYSGKGQFVIERLDLSHTVREMANLLTAVTSKKATLVQELASGLPAIEADATQIRQVIMNLITNASDALEDHTGTIRLTTGVAEASREYLESIAPERELTPGRYVYMAVSDTGSGMDQSTLQRIFDPFFTTKFTGRGLGLAAVQGIIRGHKGVITVDTAPGRGTRFTVMFPAVAGQARISAPATVVEASMPDGMVVLVVDDEEAVRNVARRTLERAGYIVETAEDGAVALELVRREPGRYGCVLLDLTMPRLSGEETQLELQRSVPSLPVVISSGFSEQEAIRRFEGRGVAGFVEKPYMPADLTAAVATAIQTWWSDGDPVAAMAMEG